MYFSEVLDNHDSAMNYEHDEPFKADDTKMWSFKVKSGVTDTNLSVGQDVVLDGKGGYQHKHKTELKTKPNADWQLKLVSSNKEHELEADWKPADMNKNGQEVEVELEAKCQPVKNTWSAEAKVSAGGFDMGPMKPWTTLKFTTTDAGAHEIDFSQSFQYEKDFHVACDLNVDKDMKLSSAYGYAAMVGASGNYYLRSNLLNPFVGVGTWFNWGASKQHFELQYDVSGNQKGLFGQPAFLRWGMKHTMGPVKVQMSSLCGETVSFKEKWTAPINKNLNLNINLYTKDIWGLIVDPQSNKVTMGVAAEMKI